MLIYNVTHISTLLHTSWYIIPTTYLHTTWYTLHAIYCMVKNCILIRQCPKVPTYFTLFTICYITMQYIVYTNYMIPSAMKARCIPYTIHLPGLCATPGLQTGPPPCPAPGTGGPATLEGCGTARHKTAAVQCILSYHAIKLYIMLDHVMLYHIIPYHILS